MIRRLARIIVAGFCLLSLLAALGTCWLWWEYRHGRGYVAEGALGGTYVRLSGEPSDARIAIVVLRGWPGRDHLRIQSQHEFDQHPLIWRPVRIDRWQGFHLFGQTADGTLDIASNTGEPLRWPSYKRAGDGTARSSGPARSWSLLGVPHQGLIVVTLLPPLLWAGVHWRRLRERRRRVCLGLCLACGYDLRESPENCPECGAIARPVLTGRRKARGQL
jgi:hypothetical protein